MELTLILALGFALITPGVAQQTPAQCLQAYGSDLGAAVSPESKCLALDKLRDCLDSAQPAKTASDDAYVAEQKQSLSCREGPTVSAVDGNVVFDVDEDRDVVFQRQRRETVSLWDLQETQGSVSTLVGSLSSTLPQQVESAMNATINGQTMLVAELLRQQTSNVTVEQTMIKSDVSDLRSSLQVAADNMDTLTNIVESVSRLVPSSPSSIRLGTASQACTEEAYGSMRYNKDSAVIEFCLNSTLGWSSSLNGGQQQSGTGSGPSGLGRSRDNPATDCKSILAANSSAENGPYFFKAKPVLLDQDPVFQVYCDFTTASGGWTLVLKAANQDTNSFSNGRALGSPLNTGIMVNPDGISNILRYEDALGMSYLFTEGRELMVRDEYTGAFVRGEFPGSVARSLLGWMRTVPPGNPSGPAPLNCGITLQNVAKSANVVSEITVLGLGLKCEDDTVSTWVCDDDASFICWGAFSSAHRSGIGKCGTDGNDDIYNGNNAILGAAATVWIR